MSAGKVCTRTVGTAHPKETVGTEAARMAWYWHPWYWLGTPGRGGRMSITGGAGTIITAGEQREITRFIRNRCRYAQLDI
jgi:hypothetical protein